MDDKHLGLLVENHTLAYLHADLWYQGINNALAVLQAQILKQPTPPLTYYPHPGQQHENDPPGSTTTLGLFAPGSCIHRLLLHFLTTQRAFIMR